MATQATTLTDGEALKQFTILAKSGKGRACVAVIEQALNHPNVFVFGELLDMPNIQELKNTEFKSYYDLLQIFAFGSYSDYITSKDSLPQLTPQMTTKLRQLTIVFLSSSSNVIPYSILQKFLDISNVRELEDLIIDSIYQNIIKGKLDQKNKHLEIEYSIGRDVQPEQLDSMINILDNWSQSSQGLLNNINKLVEESEKVHVLYHKEREEFEKKFETAKTQYKPEPSEQLYYDSMEYSEGMGMMKNNKSAKTKKDYNKRP
ncbi:hypothetical protein DICPUDRAFT_148738 [Dictyostelium purpureum]|uniref:PCI domain-containing protein n=1 Tax=Dictyostelium purpureum TaxID=5786 RepID=F0ZBV6_DICPU|nr:uncharacterized protein DICPUDRAFT_148738 [Dictyostelium purpureum]EGC38552.1 hypothetical protein DICPUDRAFT_148738 [Dictyostelium purpureum]|eukprot:XP_003284923.1 hypothetical protein DICPUDRAFT_148738 [Dictyostelium purpureum]